MRNEVIGQYMTHSEMGMCMRDVSGCMGMCLRIRMCVWCMHVHTSTCDWVMCMTLCTRDEVRYVYERESDWDK